MKMAELFLAELEREAIPTRRVLERVPEGRNDWKPHEKSMALGYLAALVASLPSWIEMTVNQDELNFTAVNSSKYKTRERGSRKELLQLFEDSVAEARG